jgi:hypothetical protein
MKITKSLVLIVALSVAGGVSAQSILTPKADRAMRAQAMPNGKNVDWFPKMTQMENRIVQLETQLAQSNEQITLLRAEIGKHDHKESDHKSH